MRFIDSINGLNQIFDSDIPKKSVVMITGGEGTVKSGFAYSLMSNYLEQSGEFGLYITLEQNKQSHIENMKSMGVKSSKNLMISDISDYRIDYSDEKLDIIDFIAKTIEMYKKRYGDKFTTITLDSLGAMYSLMYTAPHELRRKIYQLFEYIRREGITSFIILEKYNDAGENVQTTGMEGYIADGLIELGMKLNQNDALRYLRVRKMRATKHSMRLHIFRIGNNGIEIIEGHIFD
ncbi:MAG: ATPase domain-containing protein [Methanosarcinaceae archaeon]|nr:ATPase domain-containing protein [Methanosarcinaceae archaeon]